MSTIVFVVEFEANISLKENVTNVMEDQSPTGATYKFGPLVAVKPSGKGN